MIRQLEEAVAGSEYADLPEFIKLHLSPKEYLWLSDAEKARLIQNETEPDYFDA